MSHAYYNESDPFAAAWLRNLIAARLIALGDVDERDIRDVQPGDLVGFDQCHFFAGIGGWSYALRLAGWDDARPVWTGSCPCQPFSSAARGKQTRRQDDRHLWPVWRTLISQCSPGTIFGEQVSTAADWFDEVCSDLEDLDYAIGAAVLPAGAFGFDHARPRLFFVGHSNGSRESSSTFNAKALGLRGNSGEPTRVVPKNGLSSRVALRGFGNAIVPHVAEEFVRSFIEVESEIKGVGKISA